MIIVLVVAGIALLVGLFFFFSAKGRLQMLDGATTVEASQVAALAAMGSARCEVSGVSRAGERGLLTAPLSSVPCVWHRVKVEASYWDEDHNGNRRRKSRTISDISSDAPIVLEEEDGVVVVDMKKAEVDCAEKTTAQIDERGLQGIPGLDLDLGGFSVRGLDTDYERTEWIIAEGTKLFVSGRPVASGDQIGIGKPEDGPLLVSTKSEAELVSSARKKKTIGLVVIAASVVGVIVGLLGVTGTL